jgi:hypothetical protein
MIKKFPNSLELASSNTVLACFSFFTNTAGGYTRRILPYEHGSTGELSLRWGQVRYRTWQNFRKSFYADPDPTFYFEADPDLDPTFFFDAEPDPDPTFYFDTNPDPTVKLDQAVYIV